MVNNIPFKIWSAIPYGIRNPLDILRRCHHWKDSGVIFIHVPKAAGVSISRALYGRPLGHFQASDVSRVCPSAFNKLLTFGVVRHPVERLYSAYRFAIAGGTSEMGMKNPQTYKTESFRTFDSFVCEWLSKKDVNDIDGVFRPQYLYLCDGDDVIVDKTIKLECIEEGVREISEILGVDIVLGHYNKTSTTKPFLCSSETLSIIAHLYEKDFDIFSYSLEQYS